MQVSCVHWSSVLLNTWEVIWLIKNADIPYTSPPNVSVDTQVEARGVAGSFERTEPTVKKHY